MWRYPVSKLCANMKNINNHVLMNFPIFCGGQRDVNLAVNSAYVESQGADCMGSAHRLSQFLHIRAHPTGTRSHKES